MEGRKEARRTRDMVDEQASEGKGGGEAKSGQGEYNTRTVQYCTIFARA